MRRRGAVEGFCGGRREGVEGDLGSGAWFGNRGGGHQLGAHGQQVVLALIPGHRDWHILHS